jgi:hypothetical protein
MGAGIIDLAPPEPDPLSPIAAQPGPDAWEPVLVAQVVSELLARPITAQEIFQRAVGLGLARWTSRPDFLTAKAVCRLFLAAYRLAAFADGGTVQSVRSHLAGGCTMLVCLRSATIADGPVLVYQILAMPAGDGPMAMVQLRCLPLGENLEVSLDQFAGRWVSAGGRMVVAADWSCLPRAGSTFFGGFRDPDGSYRWEIADSSTDDQGNILRC